MKSKIQVLIIGRVQGVWFRASTKQQAEKLGLTGWVRNTSEGNVEAVFEGDDNKLDEMIKWCHKGSSLSKVEKVEIKKQTPPTNAYDEFSIRY
jgi:acylphosphatase